MAPHARGSDQSSPAIEAQDGLILSTYEARPEIVPRELRDVLAAHDVQTSTSSLPRFFARRGITRKRASVRD